jgi:hypothetical protein
MAKSGLKTGVSTTIKSRADRLAGPKLVVPASKARNPLVAPAIVRKAGAHKKTAGALRQEQEMAVRKKLVEE